MSESPAVAPQDASSVTTAPVNFVELLTENGTLVLIPRVVYDRLKDQDEIVLKVPLSRHYTEKEGWLTVGEAAAARKRFERLPAGQRKALVRWVETL